MKKGRWVRLTENRRLVLDVCALARDVPLFPAEREISIGNVAELRGNTESRISWTAIFAKAFALAAARDANFRRAYFRWPWPHLYEHAFSNASIAMHRRDGAEDRLCWAKLNRVEELSLPAIQEKLDWYKNEPIHVAFKKQWKLSRMPGIARRLLWQIALRMSGRERAKSLGTYTISSVAGLGAYNRFHPTILTTSLSYGPIDAVGQCLLTLICDHRVIDGYRAALGLQEIESIINTEIADELKGLQRHEASQSAA